MDTLPNPGITTVTWIATESIDAAARLVPALVEPGCRGSRTIDGTRVD